MTTKLENLESAVKGVIGERLVQSQLALGELTVIVSAKDYLSVMRDLRDSAATQFEELIDLCGVDYSTYGDGVWDGLRFAVVSHLLSIKHNKQFQVMPYPNRSHGISEGAGTQEHLSTLYTEYLKRHCPPGGR